MRLRLLTYNIRKGKGASGRAEATAALGDAIKGQSADLVLCQEVFHPNGDDIRGQSAQLSDAIGLQFYYGKNRQRRVGHHGNTTFTHLPTARVENHDVSTNPLESRGVLYTEAELAGQRLHVFNTHLGLNQRQRLYQIDCIAELVTSYCAAGDPVIVAGDFNDWNRRIDGVITGELGMRNAFGDIRCKTKRTWHAKRPVFNLDRVYLKNIRPLNVVTLGGPPWRELSDHLPLQVELEL